MKYGFGIDLGGTTVKIAYFDQTGTMLDKWEIPTVTAEGGSRILVPWTEAETWLVPGDGTFYLDTRITLQGVRDQPATNLVALQMARTLFEPAEGADDP